ncbi:CocE/NonD family hydrolase [Promicromonospora kroppenstedtii]|uniref:CocE/NonD family hydrolase n=1 Tax=Promicromonospora kroppenstedtii TaxID=440482 RepID=UPI0004B6A017|nr:CocE/NonD family hydrolase [Promicromonospora kroppenstedtii]
MRTRATVTTVSALAAVALTGAIAVPVATATSDRGQGGSTAAVATADDPVTHEENHRVPEGAAWTQHYFPSSDGSDVELHADVLLPEGLGKGAQVPVILSAGSYFGHSGEIFDEEHPHTGPSDRFGDLVEGLDLFDRGYALVLVDTRGYGGSTGCIDFAGPGEQADVAAAIDWAADQSWSTGSVGMYGKSYDAVTGLIGNNLDQDALKAVVAQEPIWDMYDRIRSNGIPRQEGIIAPNTYNTIATLPQLPDDDERYLKNSRYEETHPECVAANTANSLIANPGTGYWKDRDLAAHAAGTDTPLFVTQGFLEWNTRPEGMAEYLTNHEGPQRGWLGPWDHVRGNDTNPDGPLKMGREGWFEEVGAFYDEHLKGVEPTTEYPAFAIQDSTGAWRGEDTWPVVDRTAKVRLGNGSYTDEGGTEEGGDPAEASFFAWSAPVRQDTRVVGTPKVALNARGTGNVLVELHDVAPDGTAVPFAEQAATVTDGRLSIDLESTDWTLAEGHRLAVEIGSVQTGSWVDTPSGQVITVRDARLDLSLDDPAGDAPTEGGRATWLDTYLAAYTAELAPGRPVFAVPAPRG